MLAEPGFSRERVARFAVLPLLLLGSCGSGTYSMKKMQPCPDSPNCVSTIADDPDRSMPGLRYEIAESEVHDAIRKILMARPRTTVVVDEAHYLRFEVRSKWFRFVDDVEFLLDPEEKLIHFRSASRTGYSDLGVNRKRMEELTRELARVDGISVAPS